MPTRAQQTQNICITFIQCWTNVEDVGPMLYKCYTNILCQLGDCPTHARFTVEWIFKHVCEKKKFACDISGKKLFVFDQKEKKMLCFLVGRKKIIRSGRKTIPPPPLTVINGSPLTETYFKRIQILKKNSILRTKYDPPTQTLYRPSIF